MTADEGKRNTRKRDPIHKDVLADGTVKWRFVIDLGRDADGKRKQKRYTFDTKKAAQAKRAEIIAAQASGTFVAPTTTTLAGYLDAWLAGKRNIRPGTRRAYGDALKPVKERLGGTELQKLTKAHLDELVNWMLTSGRRVGNVQRKGVSPRTVNVMLVTLGQALASAHRQGLVARNVAELVERPTHRSPERRTWTAEQAKAFLAYVGPEGVNDRLALAWMLSLYGLRRGEVLGLRWSDVDFKSAQPTLTVDVSRVSVAGTVIEQDPKTARSRRVLPLDPALVEAFKRHEANLHKEALAAGVAYQRTGYVVVNELGQTYRPDYYSERFERLARRAGLPIIRLHDARHTCGTLLHLRGVPVAVISAWLGHASAAFTMRTYVHSQDGALRDAGTALGGLLAS